MRLATSLPLAFAILVSLPVPAHAAWQTDGNAMVALPSSQHAPSLVGSRGGALVVWSDVRNGNEDVYARFIDSTGTFSSGGEIPVAIANSYQNGSVVMADGNYGGFVAWMDFRSGNYDIYAQRIDLNGAIQWVPNGVAVSAAAGFQRFPAICGDGLVTVSGPLPGVYLAWQDDRTGTGDIYAQHITTSGSMTWAANGTPICTAAEAQTAVTTCGDGISRLGVTAGLVAAWVDARNTATSSSDIYVQRMSNAGAPLWAADGIPLCNSNGAQTEPKIVRTSGGYVVAWTDYRGTGARIYAQKVDANGNPLWTPNGVRVAFAPAGSQVSPALVSASDGGVFVVWTDSRNGNNDIYAQRLGSNGVAVWDTTGVPVCRTTGSQSGPVIVASGDGFLTAWVDTRLSVDSDLYAQRIGGNGDLQWPTNGIPVTTAAGVQSAPKMDRDWGIGAILAWQDARAGNNDVYAKRISPATVLDAPGPATASFGLFLRSPNPSRGAVRLELRIDRASEVSVDVFDVQGRPVTTLARDARRDPGSYELTWSRRDQDDRPCPAGIYFVRASAGNTTATIKMVHLQ